MNIKPRTAFIIIGTIASFILISIATHKDAPAPTMTPEQVAAEKAYQHKQFDEQYCKEHNTCDAYNDAIGNLADSVARARQK